LEIQFPLENSHKNHDPLSTTDQLCKKPVIELENKIEELVRDTRLNLVSLKLVMYYWINKIIIPKHIQEGILAVPPNSFNLIFLPRKTYGM